MSDPFAPHRDEMLGCKAAYGDIVDSDKVGLELGKVAIDENEWDLLLGQLLKLRGRGTTGRDNQSIQTMREMLFDGFFFNPGILKRR
jgi:hypothetical protein